MKIKTTSRKVSHVSAARLYENESAIQPAYDGEVATQYGYVLACSAGRDLEMEFIWKGREYRRSIRRTSGWWTAQGIVRPAKEFAAEIAGGSA